MESLRPVSRPPTQARTAYTPRRCGPSSIRSGSSLPGWRSATSSPGLSTASLTRTGGTRSPSTFRQALKLRDNGGCASPGSRARPAGPYGGSQTGSREVRSRRSSLARPLLRRVPRRRVRGGTRSARLPSRPGGRRSKLQRPRWPSSLAREGSRGLVRSWLGGRAERRFSFACRPGLRVPFLRLLGRLRGREPCIRRAGYLFDPCCDPTDVVK